MSHYKLAPKARRDLTGIWDYTRKTWGDAQAERYLADLRSAMDRIAASEYPSRAVDHIRAGYRRAIVGRHIVFFRYTDGRIEIVRVLHERMEVERKM